MMADNARSDKIFFGRGQDRMSAENLSQAVLSSVLHCDMKEVKDADFLRAMRFDKLSCCIVLLLMTI